MSEFQYTCTHLDFRDGVSAAVHRFVQSGEGIPVLLIHGSIEDSRIFYSKNGKGLAPFLASHGFDVFVPDLLGRGASRPLASRNFKHRQRDTIDIELGMYVAHIKSIYPDVPIRLGAHSWGGVLLLAWLAKYGKESNVGPAVFFASKRRISVLSLQRFFMLDIMWTLVGSIATLFTGYLPAKAMGMGSENEPYGMYFDVTGWVYTRSWKDPQTGFDFTKALKEIELPPVLYLAGIKDKVLGHPIDVQHLQNEAGGKNSAYLLLSKHLGNLRNYGHIDILTAKECRFDHFPIVSRWLQTGCLT